MEGGAFRPLYFPSRGANFGSLVPSVTVAASAASATASAELPGIVGNNGSCQLWICNNTNGTAYISVGPYGNVTAATVAASLPIPPNSKAVISVDSEVSGASVILSAGAVSGSVIFTRGEGLP